MTRRGSKKPSERRSGIEGGREAAGDGTINRSVEAIQFGDIGSA